MTTTHGKPLYLIDGTALLYRSFYGLAPLRTTKGEPTQAVYGFFRAIRGLIEAHDPDYVVIAWDKGRSIRGQEYEPYKAKRLLMPDELISQREHIEKIAHTMDLCQLACTGYEADDLIATIAHQRADHQVIIVAADKDLLQLISDNVTVWDPTKKQLFDQKAFKEKYGFPPAKLAFYHALVGDASDNIPGVKGIGEKSATELVQQFDTLDDLYTNLDKVKTPRYRTLLAANKDNAFLSFKLFTLREAPVKPDLAEMKFKKERWHQANGLFEALEMTSLVNLFVPKGAIQVAAKKQIADFRAVTISDVEALKKLVEKVKKAGECAVDTETTGLNHCTDTLVGISIACDNTTGYYIPFGAAALGPELKIMTEDNHKPRDGEPKDPMQAMIPFGQSPMTSADVVKTLGPLLATDSVKKIMHHAKFDLHFLCGAGMEVGGLMADTLIAAHLLRAEWQKNSLKQLSSEILGEEMETFADVTDGHKHFGQLPVEQATRYAAHDALQTFKLWKVLAKDLAKNQKLAMLFEVVEMPLCTVLFEMESRGIAVDVELLKELREKILKELSKIEDKIDGAIKGVHGVRTLFDGPINLGSPRQVETLLFDLLKLPLPTGRTTGSGKRSTDKEVLDELSKVHPVPALILQYRELSKLESTYLTPLPMAVCAKTGRIHTTYSQSRVATGRLASSEPNLQNIPVSYDGYDIRSAFVAPRGHQFLSADYSQIELRILAHFSNDPHLVDAFLHGIDIHTQTASHVFDLPLNKVTPEQRQVGKRINFSVLYGITPFGLSRDLGIPPSEGKKYIEAFFRHYPKVTEWMEAVVDGAKKNGYVETWLGRRRAVPGINDRNRNVSEAARRIAINTPAQGTSAEIIKLAMIKFDHLVRKEKLPVWLLLQVHDELIVEFESSLQDRVEKMLREVMEGVVDWKVPLKVSIRCGKTWGEVTK